MVRVRAWLGLGLVLAPQASYAIMLQVYDDYYVLTAIYHIGSFSHHAPSPSISAWTIPTYPFICFGNIDLSTCRPIALVNKKDPVRVRVKLGLGLMLVCGLGLWLSLG